MSCAFYFLSVGIFLWAKSDHLFAWSAEIMFAKSILFSGIEKVVNQRPMRYYIPQSRNSTLANNLTLTSYFSHLINFTSSFHYTGFWKRVVDRLFDLSLFWSQSVLKFHNFTLSFFAWSLLFFRTCCVTSSFVILLGWNGFLTELLPLPY